MHLPLNDEVVEVGTLLLLLLDLADDGAQVFDILRIQVSYGFFRFSRNVPLCSFEALDRSEMGRA